PARLQRAAVLLALRVEVSGRGHAAIVRRGRRLGTVVAGWRRLGAVVGRRWIARRRLGGRRPAGIARIVEARLSGAEAGLALALVAILGLGLGLVVVACAIVDDRGRTPRGTVVRLP